MPKQGVPKIAIVGATGSTGSATLRSLLSKEGQPVHLSLFVRSKEKLYSLFPGLGQRTNIQVWEGELHDAEAIHACLSGAQIIICTLGENRNIRGTRVLRNGAEAIVSTLESLKETNGEYQTPQIILLSSASLNDRFAIQRHWLAHFLISAAFRHTYADLQAATDIYRAAPSGLLSLLLVQPPGIVEDTPTGYELSTESVSVAVSYTDLGAAFAELATQDEYWQLGAIGVSSRGGFSFWKHGPEFLSRIVMGLISGYVPGYWIVKRYLQSLFSR